jgi:hypothetical protein
VTFPRAEAALIVALSRQTLTESAEQTARALTGESGPWLDWGLFLDQVTEHRVAALASRNLDHLRAEKRPLGVDPTVRSALRAVRLYHAEGNRLLLNELREVMDAAGEAKIPVIVRKGGHLSQTVYLDPGLRPMGDLDLLVAREQVPSFASLLIKLGYQQGHPEPGNTVRSVGRRESVFWRLYGSNLPQFNKFIDNPYRSVLNIDVNVSILLPGKGYEVPTEELIDRSGTRCINGSQMRFLASEDVLLDLCTHLYKNSTVLRFMHLGKHRRLFKYVDILEFLAAHAADFCWETFADRVDQYGVAAQVFYALAHADLLFPGEVPAGVLARFGAACPDPETFLAQYGQWDLAEPLGWAGPFHERFFSRALDRQLPPSRSLV